MKIKIWGKSEVLEITRLKKTSKNEGKLRSEKYLTIGQVIEHEGNQYEIIKVLSNGRYKWRSVGISEHKEKRPVTGSPRIKTKAGKKKD